MFKAKTISGSRGNTYFIEKELAIRKSVRHLAVINDSGDSMLCISVDLKKSSIDPKLLAQFCQQTNPMETSENPFTLKIFEKIKTETSLNLIVNSVETSLEDIIVKKDKPLNELCIQLFLKSISSVYNEQQKVKSKGNHISLGNIFFAKGELVFGGWDLGSLATELFFSNLGGCYYRAPELLEKTPRPDLDYEKCDMWSLGVCLYALYYGALPFKGVEREEVLNEIRNAKKLGSLFPSKVTIPFETKTLLTRLLNENPSARISFKELQETGLLQGLESKIGMSKLGVSHKMTDAGQRSLIDRVEKDDVRLQIETNLSHSLAMRQGESLTTVVSSVNFSALTHSKSDANSNSDFKLDSERDIDPELLQYLFEKNVVIFIMDSSKKIIDCLHTKKLQPLEEILQVLELIIVKKGFIQNYYISQIMQNKINIFNIDGFEVLTESVPYKDLLLFFKEFNDFTRQMFHKLKTDHLVSFPKNKEDVQAIELMDMDALNKKIGVYINLIYKFYKKNREAFNNVERHVVMQALVYLLYNKNSSTRFDFARFGTTRQWVEFCGALSNKNYQEIEKIFESFNI